LHLTLLAARSALALALLSGAIALLVLGTSRMLPDGGAVAFLSWRDGNSDIYVMDIVRGTLHNLTDNGAINGSFAFAPDGSRIAFESNKDGNTELYVMSVECSGIFIPCGAVHQLTDNETDSRYPVWSPDGQQIAYVYDVSFDNTDNEIYVMDVNSFESRNLTQDPADDNWPSWSPRNHQIAFASNRGGSNEIYVASLDAARLQRLASPQLFYPGLVWSFDGRTIAFAGRHIYLADVNTGDVEQLTQADEAGNDPNWLPGDDEIAFVYYADCCNVILAVNPESGDRRQVFSSGMNQTITSLSLSPDGQRWLFELSDLSLTDDSRTSHIVIVDGSGQNLRQLTSDSSYYPTWWP
jgi:TolB protein